MKLQESIRRILKEESLKSSLIDEIKQNGVGETARMVGGVYNLFKILGFKTPLQFLNIYNDLEQVESEKNPEYLLFRYRPGKNIIVYDEGKAFTHYNEIDYVLKEVFAKDKQQIKQIIKKWLSDTFNLEVTLLSVGHSGSLLMNQI